MKYFQHKHLHMLKYFGFVLIKVFFTSTAYSDDAFENAFLINGSMFGESFIESPRSKSLHDRTIDGITSEHDVQEVEKDANEAVILVENEPGFDDAYHYGFKTGLVLGGSGELNNIDFDIESGFSIGGFLEKKLMPMLILGAQVDLHNLPIDVSYGSSLFMYDLGLYLKTEYLVSEGLFFRPGVNFLGYGAMSSAIGDDADGSSQFVIGLSLELARSTVTGLSWVSELALMSSPSGGGNGYDLTATFFVLRGGIMF